MDEARPEIQLISNLVVTNESGMVLFVKHDPEDDRWWLPGDDMRPFQHPDERAREILDSIPNLQWSDLTLVAIESFRGRRGWHVMFDYHVSASGGPADDPSVSWFPRDQLPRTMHGQWEVNTVRNVLESGKKPIYSKEKTNENE